MSKLTLVLDPLILVVFFQLVRPLETSTLSAACMEVVLQCAWQPNRRLPAKTIWKRVLPDWNRRIFLGKLFLAETQKLILRTFCPFPNTALLSARKIHTLSQRIDWECNNNISLKIWSLMQGFWVDWYGVESYNFGGVWLGCWLVQTSRVNGYPWGRTHFFCLRNFYVLVSLAHADIAH